MYKDIIIETAKMAGVWEKLPILIDSESETFFYNAEGNENAYYINIDVRQLLLKFFMETENYKIKRFVKTENFKKYIVLITLHEISHYLQWSGKHKQTGQALHHNESYFNMNHDSQYTEHLADRFARKYINRFKKLWEET